MVVVICPACQENVTLPGAATGEDWARCPYCGQEYPVADLLARLPLPLRILGRSPLRAAVAAESADSDLASTAEDGCGTAERARSEGEPEAAENSPFRAIVPTISREVQVRRPQRAQHTDRRAVWEFVKIVGGGIVGCGLAVLILWWVFGRDPFELAPGVGRVLPWLIPASLR